MSFDASVGASARRIDSVEAEHGKLARQRVEIREGVRLLMERFYASSAVQALDDEALEDVDVVGISSALAACLLTRQAEERLRGGLAAGGHRAGDGHRVESARAGPQEEAEVRALGLFLWQPLVALHVEETTWQLMRSWGGAASLATVAARFDWALGISEPFQLSPQAAAHGDCGPWSTYREAVHAAVMRRLLGLAIAPPPELLVFVSTLVTHYETLRTREAEGEK